jgi:TolB-like protein
MRMSPIAPLVVVTGLALLSAGSAAAQTRIAVMPFRGIAVPAADAPLVDSLADMVSTNLAESRGIVVLERSQIKAAFDALKIDDSGAIDRATAQELGKWLGATHVVVGSVAVLGKQMRLDSRVVGLSGGVVEKSARAEGPRDSLFELINTLSSRVLVALTGETVEFNEVARTLLEREFVIEIPSPSPGNTAKFASQPLFNGVTPTILINYVAEYVLDERAPSSSQQKGLRGIFEAVTSGKYSYATRVSLQLNNVPIAVWDGRQAVDNTENQRDVTLDGIATTVSVKTGRLGTRAVRGLAGTATAVTRVPVKITIVRKTS